MTPISAEEFYTQEEDLLSRLPIELRSCVSYMAYERGHSGGYEECLNIVQSIVNDLEKPVQELIERVISENTK